MIAIIWGLFSSIRHVMRLNGMKNEFQVAVSSGMEISGVTVIPLELDDYREVWTGVTPTKALRAVDRAIQQAHGIHVK